MDTKTWTWTAAPPRCRHLRSKHFYMGLNVHASGSEDGVELPCWCLKTMQLFGPDDREATEADCTAERSCFEAEGS